MVAGASGWIEHPAPPRWRPPVPSSSQWEPIKALVASPVVTTADFDQCVHQPADMDPAECGRGPERLLGVRLERLAPRLTDSPRQGQSHRPPGARRVLRGQEVTTEGHPAFRTNAKKTCPAEMCCRLTRAISASI
eukprot:8628920-Pyramimonas_sp.AAC.1